MNTNCRNYRDVRRLLVLAFLAMLAFRPDCHARNVLLSGTNMNATIQGVLTNLGHTSTIVAPDDFGTNSLAGYHAIWLGEETTFTGLASRQADLTNFVAAGGVLLIEFSTNDNTRTDCPFADELGCAGADASGYNIVRIIDYSHPVNASLTDADLSNWGSSTHGWFTNIGSFTGLTDNGTNGQWATVVKELGKGYIVYTWQDPSGHMSDSNGPPARLINNIILLHNPMITWINTNGGLWSVASNWDANLVPGSSDVARLTNTGPYVVTLDVDATVNRLIIGRSVTLSNSSHTLTLNNTGIVGTNGILSMSGGALAGSGSLMVRGEFNWAGGAISAPLTVESNGVLNLCGDSEKGLSGMLTNTGTIRWTNAGNLRLYNNNVEAHGSIYNLAGGLFDIQNDQYLTCGCWNYEFFHNLGTVRKSAGLGATTISIPFTNSGTVQAQSGTLSFTGGGTVGGSWTAATGAVLNLAGGAFSQSGAPLFTGPGQTAFTGGTLTLTADAIPNLNLVGGVLLLGPAFQGGTITNLTVAGSMLTGTNVVTGIFNWLAGGVAGELTVESNGVLNLCGDSEKGLFGMLTNAGTIRWTNAGNLRLYNSNVEAHGTIYNMAGGLFDIQNDQYLTCGCWNYEFFHNLGVVRKSAGLGTTTISIPFTNGGTVQAQSGTLSFTGGGVVGGSWTADSGAVLNLAGGAFSQSGAPLFTGPGQTAFTGGTLTLTADAIPNLNLVGGVLLLDANFQGGSITNLTVAGSMLAGTNVLTGIFNWMAGGVAGALTVASNGVLNLCGDSEKGLFGILTNAGTICWTNAGNLRLYNDNNEAHGSIYNLAGGLFDIRTDQYLTCGCWNYEFFQNLGTVRKSAGLGATTIAIPFTNGGTVQAQKGRLGFGSSYSNSAAANLEILLRGDTPGSGYGQIQFFNPVTLAGAFIVNTNGGYQPNPGDTFTALLYSSAAGTFDSWNGLNLGAGLALQPQFTPTSLILTVVQSPVIISQPQSRLVSLGHPANLSVTAIGSEPLAYQWQKNSTNLVNNSNLSGATTNLMTLSTTTLADAGDYRIIVTNTFGSVTSTVVTVAIITTNSLQPGTWNTRAPISSARDPSVAVVNGTLYAVGGTVGCQCATIGTLEAYDPAINVWTPHKPMPTARAGMGVGVLNGLLYTIGGQTGCAAYSAKVEAYDPISNSWTNRQSLPSVRMGLGVAVVDGILYAIGGRGPSGEWVGTVLAYNPTNNSWTTKSPMLSPRSTFACAVWNGLIYTFGGGGPAVGAQRAVEVYDPVANSWTTRSPMPASRDEEPACAVINGLIYIAGGNSNGVYLASVDAYNPVTDTWTNLPPMATARSRLHGAALNDVFYVVGGYNGNCLATVEALTPAVETPLLISQPGCLANGQFQFVVNGEAGLNYTVQVSTDLLNWNTYLITNAPADSFTIQLGPATDNRNFYRLLLGP